MKNYQCNKCGIVVQTNDMPSSHGCPTGSFHSWTSLGAVGGKNYQCRECGTVVQTNDMPSSHGCPMGSFHSWTSLGDLGVNYPRPSPRNAMRTKPATAAKSENEIPETSSNSDELERVRVERDLLLAEKARREREEREERQREQEERNRIEARKKAEEDDRQKGIECTSKYEAITNFAKQNNMFKVYVCLPKLKESFLGNFKKNCSSFFEQFKNEKRFFNTIDYSTSVTTRSVIVSIPRKGIEDIIKHSKVQDYLSDNKNNDMMAIKILNDYAILSPESVSQIDHKGDPNEKIKIAETPFVVWLKEGELTPLVKSYNEFINQQVARDTLNKRFPILIIAGGILQFILMQIFNGFNVVIGALTISGIIGLTAYRIIKEKAKAPAVAFHIFNCIWLILILVLFGAYSDEVRSDVELSEKIFTLILFLLVALIPSFIRSIIMKIFRR